MHRCLSFSLSFHSLCLRLACPRILLTCRFVIRFFDSTFNFSVFALAIIVRDGLSSFVHWCTSSFGMPMTDRLDSCWGGEWTNHWDNDEWSKCLCTHTHTHTYMYMCMCVSLVWTIENARVRIYPHIEYNTGGERNRDGLVKKEIGRINYWKEFDSFVQFRIQFQESYFVSILICFTRWYVKMNILVILSIIYRNHLSLTIIEARKLNSYICKTVFSICICLSMCVCVCVCHISPSSVFFSIGVVYCFMFI
jgi:hypothetical protein